MNKWLILILACMAITAQSYAEEYCYSRSNSDCFGFDSVLTFDVGGGYRQDTFQWKTYPVSAPGVIQEEKWKNIQIGIVETHAQWLISDRFLAKLNFDFGWFHHGGDQSVTFFDQNTAGITEDVQAQTHGRVYNLDGALGYQFNWCNFRYALTPLIGYSYHFQKLRNDKYHNKLINEVEFSVHNSYKYRWRGPTVGLMAIWQICCEWQVNFTYTYHWLRYRAKISENFNVGALPGYQKSNNAHGNEFKLSTSYEFCPNWMLCLNVDYKIFTGNHGRYETDLGVVGEQQSALRNLRLDSINATVDVGFIF